MSISQGLWLFIAFAVVIAVVLVMLMARRGQEARPNLAIRTAWLVSATISGAMCIFVAAKVGELVPNATIVDVGAVALLGILTGVFLALGLKRSARDKET